MSNEIQIVNAAGSNYEIGFIIGEATKKKIKDLLSLKTYIHAEETFEFIEAYDSFYKILNEHCPEYLDELKGMAEGAGVTFRNLLKLNLPELAKYVKSNDVDQCSTIALKQQNNFSIIHNEDGDEFSDVFLLKCILPSGKKLLSLCYYGKLLGFSATLSDSKIFFVNNSLTCNDEQMGLPKVFVLRRLVELDEIDDCINYLKTQTRAKAQNYWFVKNDRAVSVEASAKKLEITEVIKKCHHTNCFNSPNLLSYEGKKNKTSGTFIREAVLKDKLPSIFNVQEAISLFSSHENAPSCFCAHGKKENHINKTLAVALFDSSKSSVLKIGYGFTCKAELKEYEL